MSLETGQSIFRQAQASGFKRAAGYGIVRRIVRAALHETSLQGTLFYSLVMAGKSSGSGNGEDAGMPPELQHV